MYCLQGQLGCGPALCTGLKLEAPLEGGQGRAWLPMWPGRGQAQSVGGRQVLSMRSGGRRHTAAAEECRGSSAAKRVVRAGGSVVQGAGNTVGVVGLVVDEDTGAGVEGVPGSVWGEDASEVEWEEAVEEARAVGEARRYVSIYDTTLRDGAQMVGISLMLADKLKIARSLTDLGVDYIEGGWPGSNPKDAEFFRRWQEDVETRAPFNAWNGTQRTRLAAFGATRRKHSTCDRDANVRALEESGAPVVTLVAKAWDEQVLRVLECSLEENLAMIRDTVDYFKQRGREVMLDAEHFFDGAKANREYALSCLLTAAAAGADVVVLCDTNGGTMPWEVEHETRVVVEAVRRWPGIRVGIHTHNDCEMAVANSLAAVQAGAALVQGCINGYGERTGNANLVSVIGGLQLKMGHTCIPPASLPRLTDMAVAISDVTDRPMPPSQPFVGSSAFAHKGGIHVAALRKMPASYSHIDPAAVGNSATTVVSELSGRGNILDTAEREGVDLDGDVATSILRQIKQLESEGCSFETASASVAMLMLRRQTSYQAPFRILEFSVISSNRGALLPAAASSAKEDAASSSKEDTEPDTHGGQVPCGHCGAKWVGGQHSTQVNQAIVKLVVDGKVKYSAAEGNGPVDALNACLRDALAAPYPSLHQVKLSDYKVRLLESSTTGHSGADSASTTRVLITFLDSRTGNKWTTVGAHTSIVEASFRALVDGLEFGIGHCDETGCTVSCG